MKSPVFVRTGILAAALAIAGLGAGAGTARADVITLDVSATMSGAGCPPTGCTLSGDIVINNSPPAPGAVVSGDVTATGFPSGVGPFTTFSGLEATGFLGTPTRVTFIDSAIDILDLDFFTPTSGSLVGYTGGPLTTEGTFVLAASNYDLISGSLCPVPEPSSLALLVTALAGLGGLLGMGRLSHRPAPG